MNGEKMAKQTGNFLTLYDGVDKYSADGKFFVIFGKNMPLVRLELTTAASQ